MRFVDKLIDLHHRLEAAALPHAFGGAIALAYCTFDPRGTDDIDVNIFVGEPRLDEVLDALPEGIEPSDANVLQLRRDGQTRLFWDRTPIDVFLSNHPFHGRAEIQSRRQPFAEIEIPVLACIDLAVFKTMFGRPKDAIDIATMAHAGCVDVDDLEALVRGLIDDEREDFLAEVRRFAMAM